METLIKAALAAGMVMTAAGATRAGDLDWDDIWAPYEQRIDSFTANSGNAQEVNSVTHMISPWPRGVRNRHIPGNGARAAGAIHRYENSVLQSGAGAETPIAKNPGEGTDSKTGGGSTAQKSGENNGQSGQ